MPTAHVGKHRGKDVYFVHVPRAGGTSICKWLGLTPFHKTIEHFSASELGEGRLRNAFTFAVVRNPWDRVVSQFYWEQGDALGNDDDHVTSFERWLRIRGVLSIAAPRFNTFCLLCSPIQGKVLVDRVLPFENLEWEVDQLARRLCLDPKSPFPRANESKKRNGRPYQDFYRDPVLREYVRGLLGFEFRRWNHSYE